MISQCFNDTSERTCMMNVPLPATTGTAGSDGGTLESSLAALAPSDILGTAAEVQQSMQP